GVIGREASAATQEWLDTANFFIEALISRPDAPIVVFSDDFETDDKKLGWTRRLGSAQWSNFVNRLTQCRLASWEPIENKGRPKSRLVFHISPAEMARRNVRIEEVAEFWGAR
ncbi:NTPase, partial [Pseudomonas sp. MWU13-2625]